MHELALPACLHSSVFGRPGLPRSKRDFLSYRRIDELLFRVVILPVSLQGEEHGHEVNEITEEARCVCQSVFKGHNKKLLVFKGRGTTGVQKERMKRYEMVKMVRNKIDGSRNGHETVLTNSLINMRALAKKSRRLQIILMFQNKFSH